MTEEERDTERAYWARIWRAAWMNMPYRIAHIRYKHPADNKLKKGSAYKTGRSMALARCLDMKLLDPKGRIAASQHVHTAKARGYRPRDSEVRRKLLLCASDVGNTLAWIKLKNLGIAHRYVKE